MRARGAASLLLLLAGFRPGAAGPAPPPPFAVELVDEATGRGVPLVELRTVHSVRTWTDSGGIAAIDEPELSGQEVFFWVTSPGYEIKPDGFGMRGVRLRIAPGLTARVALNRRNLAERLYRITGAGLYRDSLRTGRAAPVRQPMLNARVLGQDSVQTAVYHDRLFWLWGDTSRPSYPLGNYHMSGATTPLPGKGGLDPDRGIDLEYFTGEDGFTRGMAPLPGEGPTWLDALVALPEAGRERLFAAYAKVRDGLTVYERGLCRYDDARGEFERGERFPPDAPAIPHGHPFRRREGGREYVYFGNPFPLVRVRARVAALRDLREYEAFTPLVEGSRLAEPVLDRDAAGELRYAWRRGTLPVSPEEQERLVRAGKLRRDEGQFRLRDPETGKPVVIHRGSVRWNDYRKRWIMIATEIGGRSLLGEVWYAEAERLEGPWEGGRKIVTHDRYSFYNPLHHVEFDADRGRRIYFEGTYTREFSGNSEATPRYDYNQIMYRLDLADPRLHPPGGKR